MPDEKWKEQGSHVPKRLADQGVLPFSGGGLATALASRSVAGELRRADEIDQQCSFRNFASRFVAEKGISES